MLIIFSLGYTSLYFYLFHYFFPTVSVVEYVHVPNLLVELTETYVHKIFTTVRYSTYSGISKNLKIKRHIHVCLTHHI